MCLDTTDLGGTLQGHRCLQGAAGVPVLTLLTLAEPQPSVLPRLTLILLCPTYRSQVPHQVDSS